jgi:uncharacterized DUF497 family protein
VRFEWDPAKNERNIDERGLDFADAPELWQSPMIVWPDRRRDYGENRYNALGNLRGRIVVVTFTLRDVDVCRVISMRKANERETAFYRQQAR